MERLVVLNGELKGTEFSLKGNNITLGRRSDNDVCVPSDMNISRSHGRLYRRGGEWMLEDQASANGTYLFQRRIYAPTPVKPGDKFRLGRTWFELLAAEDLEGALEPMSQVVLVGEDADDSKPEQGLPAAENIVFALDAVGPTPEAENDTDARNRLAVLLDFGQALGSILEVGDLLRVAVDRVMNVVPAEQASLLLVNRETGNLVPQVVRTRGPETVKSDADPVRVRISKHIVTRAVEQGLTILTTDATSDSRFLDASSVHDLRIRSAICAPLIAHGGPTGVIYLDTSSKTHVFTQADVHLVTGIAAQTAIALENARLYTDLRRAYEDLQAAQEQLIRSETVATVGVLSASIAHDMANIVSPIRPLIDMLLDGHAVDDVAEGVLRRQTERLVTLVERLLAFSRDREVQLAPTDVNDIVRSTLTLVETEMRHRRVHLELSLADNLPPAMADPPQLERALLNLVLNAAEAMEGHDTREIQVSTAREDGDVTISVRDTGPGIPEDVQQRLFEPFYTTKETGTGLGLFSCRRIVEEEHSGSLEVDSRVGAGTTITIRIAAQPDEALAPPE